MSKKYKTIISRFAEDDLYEIIDYHKSINIDFAEKLLVSIEDKIKNLKLFPEQGRVVPELEQQNIIDYRELIQGNYRIIYAIQEHTVIIHTIIDSRRNLEDLIIKKLMRKY
ncbi:MAG: type II toxin-antitoxin system RelE/ParE family toxin [Spirochaetia bacterium]